jgi:hypothetical protein
MKTFISKILLLFLVTFISCLSSSKIGSNRLVTISNKAFTFESSIRTINFVFDTANCELTFIYKCPSISKEHLKVNINCTYTQLNDSMIVIKNKLYDTKREQVDLTPPKEELGKCISSGSANNRNKRKVSAWSNDDGFIPVINIDTIKVLSKRDKLVLYLSKRRGQDIYNFFVARKLNYAIKPVTARLFSPS